MTYDEQIEIIQAAKAGKVIEYKGLYNDWKVKKQTEFDFINNYYRIKPEATYKLGDRFENNGFTYMLATSPYATSQVFLINIVTGLFYGNPLQVSSQYAITEQELAAISNNAKLTKVN